MTAETASSFARILNVFSAAGPIAFSQWGQNSAREVSVIQLDKDYNDRVTYPLSSVTKQLTYPMPTFAERVENLSYMSATIDIVFVSIAAGGIAFSVVLAGFVFKFRQRKILVASSPLFLQLILAGTILMYLSVFAWVTESQTVACHMRFWLLGMGFVICFGALFAKTFRVMRIFGSKSLAVFRISNLYLLIGMSVFVLGEAVLLAIWSGTSDPHSYTYIPDPDRPIYNEWKCMSKNNNRVMLILLLIYNFGIALAAVWVSWKVWSIKAKMYNESRPIAFAMYNMISFGILGTALQLSNALTPTAMFAVRSVCIILSTFVTVLVLFGPKVAHFIGTTGKDYAALTGPTTTATTTTANTRSADKSGNNHNNSSSKHGPGSTDSIGSAGTDDVLYWRGRYDDINAKYKKMRKEMMLLERELQLYHEQDF